MKPCKGNYGESCRKNNNCTYPKCKMKYIKKITVQNNTTGHDTHYEVDNALMCLHIFQDHISNSIDIYIADKEDYDEMVKVKYGTIHEIAGDSIAILKNHSLLKIEYEEN